MGKIHQWSYRVFPFYSLRLEQLLSNAALGKWLKNNKTVPQFKGRSNLYRFVASTFPGEQINYLEFGVFQGDSIRQWSQLNSNPASRFVGFDSFEGLPEAWGVTNKAGDFDVQGSVPQIDDKRVSFVKGWFQDTLPGFLEGFRPAGRLVLHMDADLHSSTMYGLTKLDHLIVPGTIIIFDEFASSLHEFRAFNEYCAAYRREMEPIALTDDFATQAAFRVVK